MAQVMLQEHAYNLRTNRMGTKKNNSSGSPNGEPPRFLDKPGNVKAVLFLFFAGCAALLAADAVVEKQHAHFAVEKGFGFFAVYGFVSFVVLVIIAKFLLRPLVSRKEDYYD